MDFELSAQQVAELKQQGSEFTLLDCREPWEHQTARIEGAVLLGAFVAWLGLEIALVTPV